MKELEFFHVYTEGISSGLLFEDEQEYVIGMNCIAMSKLTSGVSVYGHTLMSNHIHACVEKSYETALDFGRAYKKLVRQLLAAKRGKKIPDFELSVKRIPANESVLSVLAYIYRNPMAAGIPVTPMSYRWGTGHLNFSELAFSASDCRSVSSLTTREKRSLLHTDREFPDGYLIDSKGMILPECYVEYKSVENLFSSPKRYLFYLSKNDDAKNEAETGIMTRATYTDDELKASFPKIVSDLFGKKDYHDLPLDSRYMVAIKMHKLYGVKAKQLARITQLPAEVLNKMIK